MDGPRLILLGASNLTRAISTVLGTAALALDEPRLEVFAGLGHGRSFGKRSSLCGRGLPGLVECGLWRAVSEAPRHGARTYSLITDIGNDIMYGHAPAQIAQWVEMCVQRMLKYGARVILTELPLRNIEGISPGRFRLVRSVLFPSRKFDLEDTLRRVRELNQRVVEIAERYPVRRVQLEEGWYGFDPIHISQRVWPRAWRKILSEWIEDDSKREAFRAKGMLARPDLRRLLALRSARPEQWWWLGAERHRLQPSSRLAGGTLVSLY